MVDFHLRSLGKVWYDLIMLLLFNILVTFDIPVDDYAKAKESLILAEKGDDIPDSLQCVRGEVMTASIENLGRGCREKKRKECPGLLIRKTKNPAIAQNRPKEK